MFLETAQRIPPRWPSGKASALWAADLVSIPAFAVDLFFKSSHTSDFEKLILQWLPCKVPGVKGSALGLVGPVSVYCN